MDVSLSKDCETCTIDLTLFTKIWSIVSRNMLDPSYDFAAKRLLQAQGGVWVLIGGVTKFATTRIGLLWRTSFDNSASM